jgi:hypothetical protein
MKHVAELPDDLRNELFTLSAEKRGIGVVAIIEKDFWVCWTLKQLFEHPILSQQLIFKGGTSLSKVYGLIDRFSEDIDLILEWRQVTTENPLAERSKSKQNKLNEEINESARYYIENKLLPLLQDALGALCEVDSVRDEKDLGHIIRVKYPETAKAGALLPYIQLEIGPLASWLPHSKHNIRPYAAEDYPEQFEDAECSVYAMDAERTFWEKATILHHEANRPEGNAVPSRYSRHYYDLCLMASDEKLKASSLINLDMLNNVVAFKKKFYPRAWADYNSAKPGTLKLIPPDYILDVMRKDYKGMQEMIFGRNPSFDQIVDQLKILETEINHEV